MAARYWVGGTGTWDASDTTHWAATSGGAGGQSVPGSGDTVTFDGNSGGGTVTVGYDPNVTSIVMGAFTGTLDMNTRNPTMQTFNGSGTGVRTLTMGSGTWTITGSNATIFTLSTSTNLTFTASTATVLCTYSGGTGTRTFIVPAINFCKISVSAGTDIFYIQMTTGGTIGTIDFTGFTGTLQGGGGSGLDLVGDLTLGAGMTTAATDLTHPYVFKGTSLQTITSNGVVLNHGITINGSSTSVILADALDQGTSTITLTSGTFNTNSKNVTAAGIISSNTNTRTLTLGSSSITLTASTAGTVFAFTTVTNLTITANTATINITGNSADIDEGAKDWNGASIVMTGTSNVIMRGTSTWANITRAPSSGIADNAFSLAGNKTCTGTFTITGFSESQRISVRSNQSFTLSSTRVITAATVVASYADFMDIQGAGAASWDLSAITGGSGDGGGNSNITFTSPTTLYWYGSSGNFSDSTKWFLGSGGTGGAGRIPLLQDTARFDSNSFTGAGSNVTFNMANYANIDCTGMGSGHTFTINGSATQRFYGSLILASGTSLPTTGSALLFTKRGSSVITSAGNAFVCSAQIATVGGTVTLGDDFSTSVASTLTVTVGTFNANGFNVTCGLFSSSNSNTRTVTMGSGTWTITGTGTVWNFGTTTSLTYDAGTSQVVVTDTSVSVKTLNFANATIAFNVLTIPASGSGVISFTATSGNREINMLRVYGTNTLRFSAGQTYKIRNFDIPGSYGTVTMVSATPASQYTLSNAGGLVRLFNVNITDAIGAGGAYWQAVNSVDGGNNSNINFITERAPTMRVGQKFAAFGGTRPYKKALYGDLHHYRKLGG